MSRRTFLVLGFLLALLIAGGLAYYASSQPDGLEKAAEDTGFSDTAQDSAVADSPLADYQAPGVDSERLSVGLAGVVGVLATAALGGGLFYLMGRGRQRAAAVDIAGGERHDPETPAPGS